MMDSNLGNEIGKLTNFIISPDTPHPSTHFKHEVMLGSLFVDSYTMMYDWMDYLNTSQGLDIRHLLNDGQEKKIGHFPVDGYDTNTNTVYQFQVGVNQ